MHYTETVCRTTIAPQPQVLLINGSFRLGREGVASPAGQLRVSCSSAPSLNYVTRIRRVKCDETKPFCTRCMSTGRKCDGYTEPVTFKSKKASVHVALVSPFSYDRLDEAARGFFQYFYDRPATVLDNFTARGFFTEVVPQVAQTEECIKHLVVAAAVLDQLSLKPFAAQSVFPARSVYLDHYGRALQLLSRHKDVRVVLVACILLVLCADYDHNPRAVLTHINAMHQLIAQTSPTVDTPFTYQLAKLVKCLHDHSPELSVWSGYMAPLGFEQLCRLRKLPPVEDLENLCVTFPDLDFAEENLRRLAVKCLKPGDISTIPVTRFHAVPEVSKYLNCWIRSFNDFTINMEQGVAQSNRVRVHVLRDYHLILDIVSRCEGYGHESLYDHHLDNLHGLFAKLKYLNSLGAQSSLLPAMFWIACKFRDPAARRGLVSLMRDELCDPEGKFLADVADTVIFHEEKGVNNPETCSDIPESNRLRVHGIKVNTKPAFECLICLPFPYNHTATPQWLPLPSQPSFSSTADNSWKAKVLSDVLMLQFETKPSNESPTS